MFPPIDAMFRICFEATDLTARLNAGNSSAREGFEARSERVTHAPMLVLPLSSDEMLHRSGMDFMPITTSGRTTLYFMFIRRSVPPASTLAFLPDFSRASSPSSSVAGFTYSNAEVSLYYLLFGRLKIKRVLGFKGSRIQAFIFQRFNKCFQHSFNLSYFLQEILRFVVL